MAAIYNNNPNRRPGAKTYQAKDFIRTPPKIVSAKEMEAALDAWASAHNAGRG